MFIIYVIMVFFLTFHLSYVAFIYVMYICSIFFQAIRKKTLQIKGPDEVRTLKSGKKFMLSGL